MPNMMIYLVRQHIVHDSLCSRQQSSINCWGMENQSESSCQIRFICYTVGLLSKYSRCMLTMN